MKHSILERHYIITYVTPWSSISDRLDNLYDYDSDMTNLYFIRKDLRNYYRRKLNLKPGFTETKEYMESLIFVWR